MTELPESTTTVVLAFWSETLSIEQMTDLAGTAPDQASAKGTFPRNSDRARTTSRWELRSRLSPFSDSDEHLVDVVQRAQNHLSGLMKLAESADACGLSVAIHTFGSIDSSPGLHLDASALVLLSKLGADFDTEIFLDDDSSV